MLLYNFYSRNFFFLMRNTLTAMFFFLFLFFEQMELRRFRVRFSKKSMEKQYTVEFHRNWKISNLLNI